MAEENSTACTGQVPLYSADPPPLRSTSDERCEHHTAGGVELLFCRNSQTVRGCTFFQFFFDVFCGVCCCLVLSSRVQLLPIHTAPSTPTGGPASTFFFRPAPFCHSFHPRPGGPSENPCSVTFCIGISRVCGRKRTPPSPEGVAAPLPSCSSPRSHRRWPQLPLSAS